MARVFQHYIAEVIESDHLLFIHRPTLRLKAALNEEIYVNRFASYFGLKEDLDRVVSWKQSVGHIPLRRTGDLFPTGITLHEETITWLKDVQVPEGKGESRHWHREVKTQTWAHGRQPPIIVLPDHAFGWYVMKPKVSTLDDVPEDLADLLGSAPEQWIYASVDGDALTSPAQQATSVSSIPCLEACDSSGRHC